MQSRYLALIVLALAACRGDSDRPMASTSDALPFLPIPPQSEVVSRTGTPDALQITFRSKSTPTEVANYYRVILTQGGWSLESDTEDAVGAMALYSLKDGHPMWIRISQTPGMPGTIVEISGAVVVPKGAVTAPATPADSATGS